MRKKYNIRYLKYSEYDLWDRFVHEHPEGTIFQTTMFLTHVAVTGSRKFNIIGVFDKQNQLIAGFAFLSVKKIIYNLLLNSYECPVYHPLIKERESKYLSKRESHYNEIITSLLNYLNNRFDKIDMNFSIREVDFRPYKNSNYKIDVNYTYILDLENFDNTFDSFDPAIKRQIKKARRNNYIIKKGMSNNFSFFYELMRKTYMRQKLELVFTYDQFRSIFEAFYEKEYFELYVLYFNDIPAAAMGITQYNKMAHYWLSASNPDLLNLGGTSALLFEVLIDIKEKGTIDLFDFVGASYPSIAKFKAGFNFRLKPVYSVTFEQPIIHLLFQIKKLLNIKLST